MCSIDLEQIPDGLDAPTNDTIARTSKGGTQPNFLTAEQINRLDAAFGAWVAKARGRRSVISRNRGRLIFLLLRYTGAKLGEILAIDDRSDFVLASRMVLLGRGRDTQTKPRREIYLPGELFAELAQLLADPEYAHLRGVIFHLDQGFMRRIISERAGECGVPRHLANPNTLRRSRALELLQSGVPLTVVQRVLGHLTANSTAAFLDLPEEEQQRQEKYFLERENRRVGGAHNTFFGKVSAIIRGEAQVRVEVRTLGGQILTAICTNNCLETLGLATGSLVTARLRTPILAPSVGQAGDGPRMENRFQGVVERITRGDGPARVVLALADGTRLCAEVEPPDLDAMGIAQGDTAWITTSAHAVSLSAG